MDAQKDEIIDGLREIVQLLHDGEQCYESHIGNVKSEKLKGLFILLASNRRKMIKDIQKYLKKLSGHGEEVKGTMTGNIHKVYENLKSLITNGDPLSISKEIKRGENMLIENYKETASKTVDENLKAALINHVKQIEDELKQVDLLSIESK